VGISAEQQKILFSKFTQANPAIASKYGGTGLGLALSQHLCRAMGGEISVTSTLGKGSCFTIRLPAIAEPPEAEGQGEADELVAMAESDIKARERGFAGLSDGSRQGERKRILIVDDDQPFLELAERLLLKEGFSAFSTNAPKGVLQLARTAKPDVILLDILMPEFDGWSVLKALRRDPVTARIPVVILSVVDEKKRAIEAGARAVVAKPVDRTELLKAVQEACRPAAVADLTHTAAAAAVA
jgi:CheY-like chemotaxis protein